MQSDCGSAQHVCKVSCTPTPMQSVHRGRPVETPGMVGSAMFQMSPGSALALALPGSVLPRHA
eukprot:1035078-Lingulodinium_polyedra.AAC.1